MEENMSSNLTKGYTMLMFNKESLSSPYILPPPLYHFITSTTPHPPPPTTSTLSYVSSSFTGFSTIPQLHSPSPCNKCCHCCLISYPEPPTHTTPPISPPQGYFTDCDFTLCIT